MAKKKPQTEEEVVREAAYDLGLKAIAKASGAVSLKYVGPAGAESPRYGGLEPGRCYQESDAEFAAYLVEQHPDHWARA